MKNIVFVCSALRSGSTLIHLMLDSHPEIQNPGEFDFFFDKVSDEGKYPDIESYHDWLKNHRIFQSKSLKLDNTLSFSEQIYVFISQLNQSDAIQSFNIHRGFDRIPFLFPDAKFLHLIRDPRDVARSSIGMGWAGNVYFGVEHWIQAENSWKRLQKKISREQTMEIKFEDLISSPDIVLQLVCNFIGVSYSDKMLDYLENSTYSKPDPSLICQWKNKLSSREIEHVEYRAHDLMKHLNYDLSNTVIVPVGMREKIYLKVTNKFFKINFAIKRYGVMLFLMERGSRLFKIKSVNKRTLKQINKINKAHLK